MEGSGRRKGGDAVRGSVLRVAVATLLLGALTFTSAGESWAHVDPTGCAGAASPNATDINSLVCGCDGDFTNGLCNPGNRPPEPAPLRAPANMACFSGVGEYSPTGEKSTVTVAFRVDVEDRSEPRGARGAPPPDAYRIRVWIPVPSSGETARELAAGACCTNPLPTGKAVRRPEVDDGGDLQHGNLQIQPELGHSPAAICPVPSGRCVP
jgi:hypothetical protein